MSVFKHILFPVDYSPRCTATIPFVKEMARKHGSQITVMNVAETPPPTYGPPDIVWHGKYQHAVSGDAAQHGDWLHSHIYTSGTRGGTATFHVDDYPSRNPLHTVVDAGAGHIPGTCLHPAWH